MDSSCWGQSSELHGFFCPISPDTTRPFACPCHAPCCCLHIYPCPIRPSMDWCSPFMGDVAQEACTCASGYGSPHPERQAEEGSEEGSKAEKGSIAEEEKGGGGKWMRKEGRDEEEKVGLLEWMTEKENMERRQLSGVKRGIWRVKGEMYGALQVYAVVMGVIYTAAANTTVLGCKDAWGPMALALVATFTTASAVRTRFRLLRLHQRQLFLLHDRARRLATFVLKLRKLILRHASSSSSSSSSPSPSHLLAIDSLASSIPPSVFDRSFPSNHLLPSSLLDQDDAIQDAFSATLVSVALLLTFFVSFFVIYTSYRILCNPCKCAASCS